MSKRQKQEQKPIRPFFRGGHVDTTSPFRTVIGKLATTPGGFGFVFQDDDSPDIFIPPDNLADAVYGDTVRVVITDEDDPRGPVGYIENVLKRAREKFVACLACQGKKWFVQPLRREYPVMIPLLHPENLEEEQAGQWAEVRPVTHKGQLYAEILEMMENSGDVTADLNAIVAEYALPPRYTVGQEAAAKRIKPEAPSREDCTDQVVVTIDPVDARDFDDALSCPSVDKKLGTITVGVHIADVACYVKRQSACDQHARERGFTSYLPGRTLPMLPTALANDFCSLKPNVERLAHTVFITIELKTGRIVSSRRAHTLIKSSQRLCYDEVADFFRTGSLPNASKDVTKLLKQLQTAATALQKYRQQNELYLPMEVPEIRVVCSEKPSAILGVQKQEHNFAHQLVEEFMLAANQCVAEELQRTHLAGIFRNHPEPDTAAMAEFAAQASSILMTKVPMIHNRKQLVRFLQNLQGHPLHDFVTMAMLRHLPRASYSEENLGHFGLGKQNYCHFTSPIRRYTDLTVHQQLLDWDMRRRPRTGEQIHVIGENCSLQEENCDMAAFAAADRMKIRYLLQLQQEPGGRKMKIAADIIKLTKSSLVVFLPDYGLIATVPVRNFPEGNWIFSPREQVWYNKRTKKELSLQSHLRLAIAEADPIRGELILRFP